MGSEMCIRDSANPDAVIVRTSWVYSHHGKNFVKTMLRLMNERSSIGVVSDQAGSPTYAADLAKALLTIALAKQWVPGVFHYSNEGVISWYQFATAIRDLSKSDCEVHAITTADFPTPAARPAYSAFDTSKIREVYDTVIPHWKDSLALCIDKIKTTN